jgi:hypothetical protein
MRLSTDFAGLRARSLACTLSLLGWLAVPGCMSAPPPRAAEVRPAVLVLENLGPCAWRISAASSGSPKRSVTVPIGETVRFEVPAGTYEITQEALAGLAANESVRCFVMPLVASETYHWRLVTLATASRDPLR